MLVTVPDTVVTSVLSSSQPIGILYGRIIDDGDVAQVMGLEENAGTRLGFWIVNEDLSLLNDLDYPVANGELLVLMSNQTQPAIAAYRWNAGQWQVLPSRLVRLQADYSARLAGLFEVDSLRAKRIAVIGLGSGGSVVATQLAKAGVGHMCLIDFDRLEVQNIARHVCSLQDVGRYKTRAVRDLLQAISPLVQVETFEVDVMAEVNVLHSVVSNCDLVVAATDGEPAKLAINSICWPKQIPVIYGAAYNRAFGGDVFLSMPPEGACYECFYQTVTEFYGPPPPFEDDLSPGYADPQRMADLIAQPGLSIDVSMIALIMARVCLTTLLRGSPSSLPELPANWVLFGNRAEWVFERPLESLFIEVPRRPNCPTCNYEDYVSATLQMSTDAARRTADEVLASLPKETLLDGTFQTEDS